MNDISKYDQAGTEDEPSGKAECDTLTRAGQPAACFRGRRKRGAHYYSKCGGGCFHSFCPLKEKKKFLKRDFVFRETREMFDILALYLEMKEHLLTNL